MRERTIENHMKQIQHPIMAIEVQTIQLIFAGTLPKRGARTISSK